MMEFELGKQYEMKVKDVTGSRGKYTLQVQDCHDKKHTYSIPVDEESLNLPANGLKTVTSLKTRRILVECVEENGKERLKLARELFRKTTATPASAASETAASAPEATAVASEAPEAQAGTSANAAPAESVAASAQEGEASVVEAENAHKAEAAEQAATDAAPSTASAAETIAVTPPAAPSPESVEQTTEFQTSAPSADVPVAEHAAATSDARPQTACKFEIGGEYQFNVFFVAQNGTYLNADLGGTSVAHVEIQGQLRNGAKQLKDRVATFVCKGYDDKGLPVFELAPSYFKGNVVVEAMEGKNVEFKQSLVFNPETQIPNSSQTYQIAKEVAAFMNTKGGKLYLGVDDSGRVTGIEKDFPHLGGAPVTGNGHSDRDYGYKPNQDGFNLKLHNIIRFHLGALTNDLLEDTEFVKGPGSNLTYAILTVKPSTDGIVYLGDDAAIAVRHGSSSIVLNNRERDEFVSRRAVAKLEKIYNEQIEQLQTSIQSQTPDMSSMVKFMEDMKNRLFPPEGGKVVTQPLQSGFIRLDDPAFLNQEFSLRGMIYKPNTTEQKIEAATKWNECYVALLKILATVNPEKFNGLPDAKEVQPQRGGGKNFARRGDNIRLRNASDYLGANSDIRANISGVGRSNFVTDGALVKRVIDYFGVALSDLAVLV